MWKCAAFTAPIRTTSFPSSSDRLHVTHRRLPRALLALPLLLLAIAGGNRAIPASLLIISVDGLKTEYMLYADAHGLKIPLLRSFIHDGAESPAVTGVRPTVTTP